jgi:hypothetical protein
VGAIVGESIKTNAGHCPALDHKGICKLPVLVGCGAIKLLLRYRFVAFVFAQGLAFNNVVLMLLNPLIFRQLIKH